MPVVYRLLFLLLLLAAAPAVAQEQPNVVVVLVDDLGYGDLGSYGSPDALTPHLDALAARGLRFTDFYAGGPICTPSRYALLTGLHPFRNGDPELLDALHPTDTGSGIDDGAVTLAEAFRDGGYETSLIGKWHLGHGEFVGGGADDTEYHPLRHGFDTFFGAVAGNIDYNTHWRQDLFLDWWEGRRPAPEDTLRYATRVFGERAAAFIEARPGAGTTEPPFFLYLPFTAPHIGMVLDPTPETELQLPIGEERAYLWRFHHIYPDDNIRKRYLAMVAVLDDEVGRVVGALERSGLMENTIVWVLSDNGPKNGRGSTGGLRGRKGTPYEGGIRVPSFVVWPGRVTPGKSGQLGANVDLLPTLAALAALPPGPATDGVDLSDHLLGGDVVARGIAVPNTHRGDAYRLGRWKFVRRYGDGGRPDPAELYDLDADPAETTDLAAERPDVVAMLEARLPYGRPPGPDTLFTAADPPLPEVPAAAVLRVSPNPSGAGGATVEVALHEGGAVRVEALDALGRRLAVLWDGDLEPGVHRLALPPTAPGVVVVRALGPFGRLSTKAVRLR